MEGHHQEVMSHCLSEIQALWPRPLLTFGKRSTGRGGALEEARLTEEGVSWTTGAEKDVEGAGLVTGGGVASTSSKTPEDVSISQSAVMATRGERGLNVKVKILR